MKKIRRDTGQHTGKCLKTAYLHMPLRSAPEVLLGRPVSPRDADTRRSRRARSFNSSWGCGQGHQVHYSVDVMSLMLLLEHLHIAWALLLAMRAFLKRWLAATADKHLLRCVQTVEGWQSVNDAIMAIFSKFQAFYGLHGK